MFSSTYLQGNTWIPLFKNTWVIFLCNILLIIFMPNLYRWTPWDFSKLCIKILSQKKKGWNPRWFGFFQRQKYTSKLMKKLCHLTDSFFSLWKNSAFWTMFASVVFLNLDRFVTMTGLNNFFNENSININRYFMMFIFNLLLFKPKLYTIWSIWNVCLFKYVGWLVR